MDFETDGAVHLRGVFDTDLIDYIRTSADHLMNGGPKLRISTIAVGDQAADRALMAPPIVEMARSYLGHEPEPCEVSNVRTMPPGGAPLPFHQDETLLGHKLVNIWVPLVDCGVDAPGLEVVLGSWRERLPTVCLPDTGRVVDRNHIPKDRVLEAFPAENFYAPAFEVGDAIVFKGSLIHRTHLTSQMTLPRTSIELRLM